MDRILYEVIPPPVNWENKKVLDFGKKVVKILRDNRINFLNLPEVVNEVTRGERTVPFTPKIDSIEFYELLKKEEKITPIINKICVRMDKREFEKWVDGAYRKGIRYFLIVGGESSKINYPGYTVLEASEYIKNKYKDVKIGGITIFTRKDEPDRIILKMKKGMEFFVSQIIFETANMKQVLLHLWRLCKVEHLKFPFLYISIAPAQKIRDIEFMKWLGVEFPSAVISYLTQSERKVEIRSFEIINRILDETFEFMEKERIKLGFNVEHVMYSNLELSEKIVKSIKEKI